MTFFFEKKFVISLIPLYSCLNFFADGSMPYKLYLFPNNFKKEASLLPISKILSLNFIKFFFKSPNFIF